MLKVQEIREIIQLIDQSSITEFTYEVEGASISLKKAGNENVAIVSDAAIQQAKPVQEKPQAQVVEQPVNPEVQPAATNTANYDHEIVSPMVGTFYAASSPESDPFATKGSSVEANTIVCIVEAMKLFNEIEAEISGEIVEVLVENGELVEYGQPLFRVKKK
ncbi:acetyl-CoA carboxylase biotin carboxyl carrier protein [Oceanobacillus polygoni]|uniref:Biotin carboxyl carrier protein of acetyl-CoA carboxylase n=1 Tax=Oceanobacillus polygoni TaxID=1235259 RepID=A0A9X0YT95_9BACI|nr:acetyl-CoA carboxylase biotin carboxyl carrier protein [Oceanobacillus polygoni]MBP2078229.1 acetyl-CoA carboxylase biotin carboxyl carrier protein [Oceanobacillus polygoni]